MVAASRAKSSDRAAILKKLLPAIKKQYKVVVPKHDRPVLETMLFAICLEDVSVDEAERAFERMGKEFPDLNEIRVSSISEIERAFADLPRSEWRAFHVRSVLQYVFEKSFAFEFEGLRKKTLELAQKQLAKITHLSNFVRNYTLQSVIGAHQIPIDDAMARALIWLGLVPPNQDPEQMGETLKAVVRKSEVPQFCFSLRCLATDKSLQEFFDSKKYPPPSEGHDGAPVTERLAELHKAAAKSKTKAAAKVVESKSVPKSVKGAAAKSAKPAKPATKKKKAPATAAKVPKRAAAPVKKVVKKAR
jgi:endonuclease-3